jgi:hypothetical protein
MSEEGIRVKRKLHEILGLEFAKRGIRYPGWQVLPDRRLLPASGFRATRRRSVVRVPLPGTVSR